MNKQLSDYINGVTNVVRNEFVISREKNKNGELIFVNTPDTEIPMYALWNSNKLAKRHKIKESEDDCIIEKITPKNTGGKPAYLMLMQSSIDKIENLSVEASGLLLKLFSCVEWNTCRLIDKRSKKPLTRQMMMNRFNLSMRVLKRNLSELSDKKLIEYRGNAYFLNKEFVRKGR